MSTPTVQDFVDAKVDVDDLEAIVNGSTTVTTRQGGDKLSVDQALSQIVVGQVTVYSAATQYTAIEEWVEEAGVMYRPLPSQLPIGPEAFDPAKWSPVNGLNLANLQGTQNGSVRPDMNAYLDNKEKPDYASMIAAHAATPYKDGDTVYITNEGIAGDGVVRFSAGHGITSTRGVFVALNADWYWERVYNGPIFIEWFELAADGTDETALLQSVVDMTGEITTSSVVEKLIYTTSIIVVPSNTRLTGNWGITTGDNNLHSGIDINGVTNVTVDEKFTIKGQAGEDGFDAAILIRNGSTDITIDDAVIDSIGSTPGGANPERGAGIYVTSSSSALINENIKITDNKITNIKGAGDIRGDFVYLSYVDRVWVEDNDFDQSERMGVALTDYVTNFHINKNGIINPGLCGVDVEPNIAGYTTKNGEINSNTITNYGSQNAASIGVQKFAVDFHGSCDGIDFFHNTCTAGPNGIQHINAQNGAKNFKAKYNKFYGAVSGDAVKTYAGSGTSDWDISENYFGTEDEPLTGIILNAFGCDNINFDENTAYGDGSSVYAFFSKCNDVSVCASKKVSGFTKLVECRASTTSMKGLKVKDNITVDLATYGVHLRPSGGAVITGIDITGNTFDGDSATNVMFFEYLTGGTIDQFTYLGNTILGSWSANSNSVPVGTTHFAYYVNTAAVATPFAGEFIYSFADNSTMQYNGSTWE